MSNAIEIEAKVLINKEGYELLSQRFSTYPKFSQTNYYIENQSGQLQKENLSLRIREREGLYEVTLKTPLSEGLLEKNCTWTKNDFISFKNGGSFPEGDIKRFLIMMDIDTSTLTIKTKLTTNRIDAPYEDGKLSIDENHYCGQVDYEVELEHNSQIDAETNLKKLLDSENIPFIINKKTKTARAFEAFEANKNK